MEQMTLAQQIEYRWAAGFFIVRTSVLAHNARISGLRSKASDYERLIDDLEALVDRVAPDSLVA
jgi:hypothetical protein